MQDVVDRVPGPGARGDYLKKATRDKLIEHKNHNDKFGEDLPDIRDWTWDQAA